MVTDPICGMAVDEAASAHSYRQAGIVYFFCSGDCLNQFAARAESMERLERVGLDLRQSVRLNRAENGFMGQVEKTMNIDRRWLVLVAALLTLSGCAAEGPVKPAGLEQKIEAARTRADHGEIAAIYEQQADADKEAGKRHRNLARAYERGWVWAGPKAGGVVSARKGNQNKIAHCDNLARIFQQAAAENLSLAGEHRQMAAGAKE